MLVFKYGKLAVGGINLVQMDSIARLDPLRPITPQITQLLRERIIKNHLAPGNRISETEIASTYNVSRQPVREAFIKLQEQGLLTVLPQRGTFVSKITYQAVLDAQFLREAIEADILLILASAPPTGLVANLRQQLETQRALGPNDAETFILLDETFHRTLAEAAGKGGAWKQIEGLKSQMDRVRFLAMKQFPVDKLIRQHGQLVDALEQQNPTLAQRTLRLHLREVLSDFPIIIKALPDIFDLPDGEMPAPINTPLPGSRPTSKGKSNDAA
jgi:GntR family transcriptional regulator, rspAB operon transcriptional repressor